MASNERFVDNVRNPELSDTEEMEESEAEGARGESDSEVFFRPQAQPFIRRIQDSEEIAPVDLMTNIFADSSTDEEGDEESESQSSDRSRSPGHRRIQLPEASPENAVMSEIRRIQDLEEIAVGYAPVDLTTDVFADSSTEEMDEESESQSSDRSRPSGYRRLQLPGDSSENAAMSEGEARSDSEISVISNISEVGREFHSVHDNFGLDGNSGVSSRGGQSDEENENSGGPNSDIEIVHDSTQSRIGLPSHLPPTPPAAPSTSKEDEPSATSSTMQHEEDESAQTCPICFEVWNNVGSHRIVSLKCGHLFGKQCIERWLQKPANAKCPQCNAKANKRDIRVIYAKCVKVEDTSERERLMQEIERLKQENDRHEKDRLQQKMRSTLDYKFITELQKQLKLLQESTTKSTQSTSSQGHTKLKLGLYQTIDLSCKNGSSRVMAFNEWMNMLVISIPSHIEMFPGFGMKKISTIHFKTENFYLLHSKQIRDMAFNSLKEDLLLSVGFDKVAKVTNVSSNSTVVSYTTDALLWSCCWSRSKMSDFFVGSASGVVYHFDTVANTESYIKAYNSKGSGPVVSLSYVARNHNASFMHEGLLVTRLNNVSFEELGAEGCISHDLSIEGTFTNTSFDPVSMHFITTCRPSDRNLHVRHKLYALKSSFDLVDTGASVVATEIHSFQGSTTLKHIERTCLTTRTCGQSLMAIFNEESTNSVKLCDVSTTTPIQTIKPGVNIIDILPIKGIDGEYIAMLAERCIKIYKWIPQF